MKKVLLVLFTVLLLGASALAADAPEPAGYIALTFDDGPSGPITEALLDGLRERGAHATFFLCGYRMKEYPGPLLRYLAEGHELGVHSTEHLDLTGLDRERLREDLGVTAQMIRDVTGRAPTLMRPPGGAYNDLVRSEAKDLGLSVVLWSVDPRDWASKDASAVREAMAGSAGDGDVILMHDMSRSSVEAALGLIDALAPRGYRFVTVSELFARKGQTLTPGEVYDRAK